MIETRSKWGKRIIAKLSQTEFGEYIKRITRNRKSSIKWYNNKITNENTFLQDEYIKPDGLIIKTENRYDKIQCPSL